MNIFRWPMQFGDGVMSGRGVLLECGHVSAPVERLRVGNEKWCEQCMAWRLEQQ